MSFAPGLSASTGSSSGVGFFVLDFDQIDRLFGDQLALRRHRRDFFADKPHFAIGEDRHVVEPPADFQAGAVLRR